MPSVIDVFEFPFHDPKAQRLLAVLAQINSTSGMAILAAQTVGIDVGFINRDQAPTLLWAEILSAAAVQGLTRKLVEQTRDRLNPNSPQRPFLDQLLADQPAAIDDDERGVDGAPRFLKDTDDVREPEALLYYDDLMIQMGQVPALINTLQRLVALAPGVCKLSVDLNGLQKIGTAFRIGSNLLLTNWHVLHRSDNSPATAVTAEFGYEDDGKGGGLSATAVPCNVETIVTSQADDWAIIQSSQSLSDAWPMMKLSEAVTPVNNTAAYIIQHPNGERKRLGFVRNQVSFFDDRVVHYLTDTREGSSGSPVLNAQGQLIALHRAGGRPQEVLGKAPLKKNEGIRISRIIAGCAQQNFNLP